MIRVLGELLGFTSTRPDNDEGIGPDVLWRDEKTQEVLGFELKTDKSDPSTYTKDDVGQGHNQLEWMGKTYSEYRSCGSLFVGPNGHASHQATASSEMGLCLTSKAGALRAALLALIEDIRQQTPMERLIAVKKEASRDCWSMAGIFKQLHEKRIQFSCDCKSPGICELNIPAFDATA